MPRLISPFAMVVLVLTGCASYVTPGGPVSVPEIIDADIGEALSREPAASFPANLVVARVQAPGYASYSNQGYGQGKFSVLTARDIETEEDFARIEAFGGVADVGSLSRLLLPRQLDSLQDLRAAAARLRGDIMLLYTLDTAFRTDTQRLGPLQAVGLGFFPNKKAHVTATCSVAFIDVRTGYVYGVAESTAIEEQRSNHWNNTAAIEEARVMAEQQAFAGALTEAETAWNSVVARYADAPAE